MRDTLNKLIQKLLADCGDMSIKRINGKDYYNIDDLPEHFINKYKLDLYGWERGATVGSSKPTDEILWNLIVYPLDWEQIDIRPGRHEKYAHNYIYYNDEYNICRYRDTANEFYHHVPNKDGAWYLKNIVSLMEENESKKYVERIKNILN